MPEGTPTRGAGAQEGRRARKPQRKREEPPAFWKGLKACSISLPGPQRGRPTGATGERSSPSPPPSPPRGAALVQGTEGPGGRRILNPGRDDPARVHGGRSYGRSLMGVDRRREGFLLGPEPRFESRGGPLGAWMMAGGAKCCSGLGLIHNKAERRVPTGSAPVPTGSRNWLHTQPVDRFPPRRGNWYWWVWVGGGDFLGRAGTGRGRSAGGELSPEKLGARGALWPSPTKVQDHLPRVTSLEE